MKCGLIWARSARTSASISRVRLASSSASSSWPETHCATSSAARASPAVGYGANTCEGADDPLVDHQRADHRGADRAARLAAAQVAAVEAAGVAAVEGAGDQRGSWAAWWSPAPSQASSAGGVGERHRRRTEQHAQVPDRLARRSPR